MCMGVSQIRGTFLGGPQNKDFNVLGSILGVPLVWEATMYLGVHKGI